MSENGSIMTNKKEVVAPLWFHELLEQIADCFEVVSPTMGWQTWYDDEMWHGEVFPSAVEGDGGSIFYPSNVHIDVKGIASLFEASEDADSLTIEANEDGVDILGSLGGEPFWITALFRAPDDVEPTERLVPGGSEEIARSPDRGAN